MNGQRHSRVIEAGGQKEDETMFHFQSAITTMIAGAWKNAAAQLLRARSRRIDALWLMALLGVASLAAADAQVGTFAQQGKIVSRTEISRAMGECVLKRDRRDAIATVENNTDSPAFKKAAHDVEPDMVACLRGQRSATIGTLDFRGAVAEALLAENAETLLNRASGLATSPAQRVSGGEGMGAAYAMFDCAVAAAPSKAADLMRADAATPAEAAAFSDLGPVLQQCAPASGAVKVKTFQVRPLTAIALYRLLSSAKS